MKKTPKKEHIFRASITLPEEIHASLSQIAEKKKVSLAWVIRDAAEQYVSEQFPLFAGHKREQ